MKYKSFLLNNFIKFFVNHASIILFVPLLILPLLLHSSLNIPNDFYSNLQLAIDKQLDYNNQKKGMPLESFIHAKEKKIRNNLNQLELFIQAIRSRLHDSTFHLETYKEQQQKLIYMHFIISQFSTPKYICFYKILFPLLNHHKALNAIEKKITQITSNIKTLLSYQKDLKNFLIELYESKKQNMNHLTYIFNEKIKLFYFKKMIPDVFYRFIVKSLLTHGSKLIHARYGRQKNTLLHIACALGDDQTVNYLLELSGIDINSKNANNLSPLEIAFWQENWEIFNALRNTGASIKNVANHFIKYMKYTRKTPLSIFNLFPIYIRALSLKSDCYLKFYIKQFPQEACQTIKEVKKNLLYTKN